MSKRLEEDAYGLGINSYIVGCKFFRVAPVQFAYIELIVT